MRPIEYKILKMLEKESLSFDGIEEIIDSTSRQELKKSFPDECHFQTSRFFAKTVIDSLLRSNLVKKEGNKYIHKKQLEKGKQTQKP
ncbi:MAG: hypothetical protein K0B81_08110 [Candidatus Cloacimonetes bacterium]|nr:hypothetical protein [Candidatus Cloacimonadota bacterium]